ncbi:MAG: shikimate kinase [Cyclobacteriaceae bacterium]
MKVFLVGMPGSGKSTLGRQLGRLLDHTFIDLDHEIEHTMRMPVSEIFRRNGETYFRELERDTLDRIMHEHENFVLATGGGTPCFYDNMKAMNEAGITVYLDIPTSHIIGRMSAKGMADRPLFQQMDPNNLVRDFDLKFSYRIPFYRQAKIEIAGEHITAERIAHLLSLKTKN